EKRSSVIVWDLETLGRLCSVQVTATSHRVMFHPHSNLVASGWSDGVRAIDTGTGVVTAVFPHREVAVPQLSFRADGRQLAMGEDSEHAKLASWDLESRQRVVEFGEQAAIVTGLVFTPDGKRLATAMSPGSVELWDAVTGTMLRTHSGRYSGGVIALTMSAD